MKIAVVDDEKDLRETLTIALEREGFQAENHPHGLAAWNSFQKNRPDLAILDVKMPHLDGLELCKKIRAEKWGLPILFLSSKAEEIDRILGLELGGDDYLCKPFSLRELLLRIKILLRRSRPTDEEKTLHAGSFRLHTDACQAFYIDKLINLTVTEYQLLEKFLKHPMRLWTRAQLMLEIYGEDTFVSSRTIDTHIKRLRQKIKQKGEGFDGIETVYGMGYRFNPEI